MGPNVLWLAESLVERMDVQPGMRILDMGCGRAISSIFLAREFDVQVWAADLWIKPADNLERIRAAGLQDRIFPIYAEAHALPFASGYFDAMISLDAYHYFGTDDLYLGYYSSFAREGAQIGIAVPGLRDEFGHGVPVELVPFWEWEFCSFHSPEWWRNHWEKTGLVHVTSADNVPRGHEQWLHWLEVAQQYGYSSSEDEARMLRVDEGRNLGFSRVVATVGRKTD